MKPEYAGCICHDCETYEQEGAQRCVEAETKLFLARDANGKLLDFGDAIRVVVPPDTQACELFSPSKSWLLTQAEARSASQHQQAVRGHKGFQEVPS